jgi:hypothetical protein
LKPKGFDRKKAEEKAWEKQREITGNKERE